MMRPVTLKQVQAAVVMARMSPKARAATRAAFKVMPDLKTMEPLGMWMKVVI